MTCHEVRRLLSVRKEWTRGEQDLAEAHLADCPACAAIAREYDAMDRRLGALLRPEGVVALRSATWARIHRPEPVRTAPPSWRPRASHGVALVAALALVVALGVMLSAEQTPGGEEPGIVPAVSSPAALPLGGVLPTGPAGRGERINLLLLGIDRRGGTSWTYRTDTILLVTADPAHKTAGMLSIPRDLEIEIPGYGENRINVAHEYGELDNYAGGGPALLARTIEVNFGVSIDYYVMVDFQGFVGIVDALGGIEVDVPEVLHDTEYPNPRPDDPYGYRTVHFDAGPQHMDGEQALEYARSRMSTSDLDRAKRQQLLLLAIRDKALDADLIPRLPELVAQLSGEIKTDLTLEEMVELAALLPQIDPAHIKRVVLEEPAVYAHRREDGAAVLLPRWDLIRPLVDELFSSRQAMVGKCTVRMNDTVWSIAQQFGLPPETLLWSNPTLEQCPDFLTVGQELLIPPVAGVLYTVQAGDTLHDLAQSHGTTIEKIVVYEPNDLQGSGTLVPGEQIMLPDGAKEMPATGLCPMPETGSAPAGGLQGSGHFHWPATGKVTQPYWSGHLGIDIGNAAGTPILAADRGTVILVSRDAEGYGNQVVIDHRNGFMTLYAHLQDLAVQAGEPVEAYQELGSMGTTGQATGPQLHFELIRGGVRVDPLQMLP